VVVPNAESEVAARISAEIDKAVRLSERGLNDSAWQILKAALRLAENANLRSAYGHFLLAGIENQLDNAEGAVENIVTALELDPIAPPFRDAHRVISERVRVTFDELDVTDVAVPNLFRLLARLGVVDAAALVKQSRHVAVTGNPDAALGLAQHAVDREPRNAEALRHLASLLARAGRHQESRERRLEADAIAQIFPCPEARA
jgi:tetratricopeptide (TPR) repeat protein